MPIICWLDKHMKSDGKISSRSRILLLTLRFPFSPLMSSQSALAIVATHFCVCQQVVELWAAVLSLTLNRLHLLPPFSHDKMTENEKTIQCHHNRNHRTPQSRNLWETTCCWELVALELSWELLSQLPLLMNASLWPLSWVEKKGHGPPWAMLSRVDAVELIIDWRTSPRPSALLKKPRGWDKGSAAGVGPHLRCDGDEDTAHRCAEGLWSVSGRLPLDDYSLQHSSLQRRSPSPPSRLTKLKSLIPRIFNSTWHSNQPHN